MNFNRRVFFTLFPSYYWIIIAIGMVVRLGSGVAPLGNLLINVGVFLLAIRAGIVLHEIGHLLAAKSVGGIPRRLVLGHGHEIYRQRYFGIAVVVCSKLSGGHAYASFESPEFLKLRSAVYFLGGALMNFLVAAILYLTTDLGMHDSEGNVIVSIPFSIFVANVILLTLTLLPYHARRSGVSHATDGLLLLKLPFMRKKDTQKQLDSGRLWEAYEHLEKKAYDKAREIIDDYTTKYPDSNMMAMNLAFISLKTGQFEKSLEQSMQLLNSGDKMIARHTEVIYNQIAWTSLVLNDLESADYYSERAFNRLSDEIHIRGTRGCTLVALNRMDEASELLLQNLDFRLANNATLCAASFLMVAFHRLGEHAKSDACREFVMSNADAMDVDERLLFERNLEQVSGQAIITASGFNN